MIEEVIMLFILGITVSFGPCIAHCSLVILPYIAATAKDWKGGFRVILIFSVVRLAIYGTLGLLAGLLGRAIIEQLLQFEAQIMIVGGVIITSLGLYIFLRRDGMPRCQAAICKHQAGIRGSALLGISAGVLPCLPLLGVLTFTALYAQDLWQGAFYGLAFGAGKFFSPLIVLGMLAGSASAFLTRYGRAFSYFTRLCGALLIVIGISLIVPELLPRW
ncbi:sulfite exporter TauE/SafE family protein [Thermodesulfovibrionales bacterium]|nr:sulfite exporter TauE/SafE family protein [Thermodesulfovibrionales bacterium]